jgi:hypothetical protein
VKIGIPCSLHRALLTAVCYEPKKQPRRVIVKRGSSRMTAYADIMWDPLKYVALPFLTERRDLTHEPLIFHNRRLCVGAIGDPIDFLSAGAYTRSVAAVAFNGFPPIRSYFV